MWYKSLKDETDVGLRMLHTDKNAMDMARIGMRDNMVELFVVYKDADTTRKGCTIKEVEDIDGGEAAAPTADTVGPGPIVLHKTQSFAQAKVGKKPKVVTKAHNDVLEDGDEERSDFSGGDESEDDDYRLGNDDEGDSDEQWSENSSRDSDLEVAFDDNDDDRNGDGSVPTEREQGEHSGSANKGKEQVVAAGLRDDDGYESEGLWDVPVSDDEGDPLLRRYPLYKSLKNMKEYKWEVGTMYVDMNAFKECVTSYAVHNGRGIWFSKCDSHRCKAICKEGCKWFAYCHKMKREDTWQLTSCYKKHTCSKATKICIMSSQWLSKAFMKKICENPKIKLRSSIKKAHNKWNVDLTMTKAARVKQQALDEINGTYGEQYKRIHDYAAELLRCNSGSTVQIQVERPPEFQLETPTPGTDMRPRFQRIYICLDACKRSFMVCRPMISLDGCFIKTPYGGQLLTAIGWDPNDQILPITYAVVEAKIKDSWRWFLLNLCDDLGVDKIRWCTFMSDQQKGLIPTFDELLPGIDHMFCVRQLYSNFRKRFPGVQLKMMMWKAAKATYVQEWERRMKEIQQVDQGAYNHLMEIPVKEILPKINKKIEREFDKGEEWLAIYAGRDKYEVSISQGNRAKFVVDLNLHECYCRKFQLTGYPCEHAMSCIRKMCLDVKNYVNKCYRKETYVDCYQHVICPLNGPNLWSQIENDDVLPPVFRKAIGHPKLSRNKTGDEPRNNGPLSKLSRTGQQQKCSYCFALGHNKRTCPRKRKMKASTKKQNATP
ncbi:uncharacterized protein LOC127748491 [Arachis duranensis]|uniref:Uncharacterized protein LOC127748491 n=1 Tax=Arachis duranensis TaxID=130453 RepID=A0A9C6TRZ5_ARADU|nr:uncharacterized protein LOC127748491 [Arachis duranensis]